MVGNRPLSALTDARIETAATTYWAGEVFTFTRTTSIVTKYFGSIPPDFDWSPPGVILEDWTRAVRSSNDTREIFTQTARAYIRGVGTVALPDATQPVALVTSRAGDGSAITDNYTVPVTSPRLTVKPLPTPRPAEFANAVGEFTLKSTLSTVAPKVGEAVTWTLELTGTGNWPEINRLPGRVISKDFNAVAPIVKRAIKPGTLFDGTISEDILLVPTKPGEYQLGPVRFIYFDPKRGKYQLITTETYTVTVEGKAVATGSRAEPVIPSNGPRMTIPTAPQPLPLDPLGGGSIGIPPISPATQATLIGLAAIAVLVFWLRLAAQRSEVTDPLFRRRRARAELETILTALDRQVPSRAELHRLLFAWERITIEFAGLELATPSSIEIAQAIEPSRRGGIGSSWAPLWRDANGVLYGKHDALPADWVMRARAALSEQNFTPVPFHARFLRRNLLPFVAGLFLFLIARTPARADGLAAYQKGDFAAAEKEWRHAVATTPLDARAHYNLALAVAQQDRWAESLAQSLAAFCLQPRDASIRWQFSLSLDRAGIDNPAYSGFANGTGRYRIARFFSPGEWGLVRVFSALLAAVFASLLLRAIYRRQVLTARWTTGGLLAVALVIFATAGVSLQAYGPLTDPAIAIVGRHSLLCSVPTEIDTTQKTVPLPAGSLATVDRTFLGWSRIVFANHQTGWIRSDALVQLYR